MSESPSALLTVELFVGGVLIGVYGVGNAGWEPLPLEELFSILFMMAFYGRGVLAWRPSWRYALIAIYGILGIPIGFWISGKGYPYFGLLAYFGGLFLAIGALSMYLWGGRINEIIHSLDRRVA